VSNIKTALHISQLHANSTLEAESVYQKLMDFSHSKHMHNIAGSTTDHADGTDSKQIFLCVASEREVRKKQVQFQIG